MCAFVFCMAAAIFIYYLFWKEVSKESENKSKNDLFFIGSWAAPKLLLLAQVSVFAGFAWLKVDIGQPATSSPFIAGLMTTVTLAVVSYLVVARQENLSKGNYR